MEALPRHHQEEENGSDLDALDREKNFILKFDGGVIPVDGIEANVSGQFKIIAPLRLFTMADDQLQTLSQRVCAWFQENYNGTGLIRGTIEGIQGKQFAGVGWALACTPPSWTSSTQNFVSNLSKLETFAKLCATWFMFDDIMDAFLLSSELKEGGGNQDDDCKFFCKFCAHWAYNIFTDQFKTEEELREKFSWAVDGQRYTEYYPYICILWKCAQIIFKDHSWLNHEQKDFLLATPNKMFFEGPQWLERRSSSGNKSTIEPMCSSKMYQFFASDRTGVNMGDMLLAILEGINVTRQLRGERPVRRMEHLTCQAFQTIHDLLGLKKMLQLKEAPRNNIFYCYKNEGLSFDQILMTMSRDIEETMTEITEINREMEKTNVADTDIMKYVSVLTSHVSGMLAYHMFNETYFGVNCFVNS